MNLWIVETEKNVEKELQFELSHIRPRDRG